MSHITTKIKGRTQLQNIKCMYIIINNKDWPLPENNKYNKIIKMTINRSGSKSIE